MVSFAKLFKFTHTKHLCDPQDCVSAATSANPPNAAEHDMMHRKDSKVLDPHYVDRDVLASAAPRHHPNAGIGGFGDVHRRSNIGGYHNIDRKSEIGNDHAFSDVPGTGGGAYVIRTVYRTSEDMRKATQAADGHLR
ncbi:hypothetical protein EV175_000773 [Coemansia sp. RSA 1933]|nr:hypothetical protein EV175_000773 [Coemansia sp. RSA 1933]